MSLPALAGVVQFSEAIVEDGLLAAFEHISRREMGEFLASLLEDDFQVVFRHFLANVPVHDEAAEAIEHATKIVKRSGDAEVADIDVPMQVGLKGLLETGSFFGRPRRLSG